MLRIFPDRCLLVWKFGQYPPPSTSSFQSWDGRVVPNFEKCCAFFPDFTPPPSVMMAGSMVPDFDKFLIIMW